MCNLFYCVIMHVVLPNTWMMHRAHIPIFTIHRSICFKVGDFSFISQLFVPFTDWLCLMQTAYKFITNQLPFDCIPLYILHWKAAKAKKKKKKECKRTLLEHYLKIRITKAILFFTFLLYFMLVLCCWEK